MHHTQKDDNWHIILSILETIATQRKKVLKKREKSERTYQESNQRPSDSVLVRMLYRRLVGANSKGPVK